MKYRSIIFLLFIISTLLLCPGARAAETHAESIIAEILTTRQAILANGRASSSAKYVFLAFWDFDGTILKGDCSEGMQTNGKWLYKGLAQLSIEAGYSEIYPPEGGALRFSADYRHMEHDIGKWLAYPFIPQMLRGTLLNDIHHMSAKHFSNVLANYYFNSSIRMLNGLEDAGVRCYIISASADVFVDASAPTLGLPLERFNGIEVQIKRGRLTEKLIQPVTWSDGKTEKLTLIVEEIQRRNPDKQVLVLAAFGNSYGTDGPFMKHVVTQTLPKGKPVAVMINGGETPQAYRGLFTQVQQSQVVPAIKTDMAK